MLQAVFFDLDQTLIDSDDCHLEAGVRAFQAYGMDYLESRRITGSFLGLRMVEIMAKRRDVLGLTEEQAPIAELNRLRERYYTDLIPTHVRLLPGAVEAVRAVADAGAVVAVVSSETEPCVRAVLDYFGLAPDVAYIVTGDQVTHGKPDPEPYELAFTRLQAVRPARKGDCLVVEDSVVGASAAIAAGLPVCLVPLHPLTTTLDAQFQLTSLLEFPALLAQLTGAAV